MNRVKRLAVSLNHKLTSAILLQKGTEYLTMIPQKYKLFHILAQYHALLKNKQYFNLQLCFLEELETWQNYEINL